MFDVVNPLQNTSYTNKDFTSVYVELLDLVKDLTSMWDPSISNESDPGVILLKLNAILADKLSYNSDTNILEAFPLSVTQEKNARQLFEQLGYYMHWYRAASTDVSIAWIGLKDAFTEYTIPAFTMVSDYNNQITYTLIGPSIESTTDQPKVGDQKLKLDGSNISFKALQGIPVEYSINGDTLITINNLDEDNRLYFPTTDIAENGIFITNAGINNYSDWKRVDNLLIQNISTSTLKYKFGVSQDTSTCYIEFPENAEDIIKNGINITYIKTLGEDGNVAYKTIEKFLSEFNPVENQEVLFTTENIKMLNYSAAIDGKNPQTINSAYKGYKSTSGVFDTLITLRDYISYILNSGLVSNGFVCDRTSDIQSTYSIMTYANEMDTVVTAIEYERQKPVLSAFDLKLYLLQVPNSELTNITAYNTTYNPLDKAHIENVKSYIEDIKCISHDYAPLLPTTDTSSHFCYFKNKYPIICRVVPQYQLTQLEINEMTANIRTALYEKLNAAEVTFGEEVPYEIVYNTIVNADKRIKSVVLDNIEYTSYAVCYNDTLNRFFEVEISSEDENPITCIVNSGAGFTCTVDEETFTRAIGFGNYGVYGFTYDSANLNWILKNEAVDIEDYGITIEGTPAQNDTISVGISLKTQFRDEILTKSILAGVTSFLVDDEKYSYKLDQYYKSVPSTICSRIKAISTDVRIPFSNTSNTYTMRENESVQLYSPNIISTRVYSTYVKFEYRLNSPLASNEDYQLKENEYFILYWKESEDDTYYKYAIYGQGNIIRIESFDLPANNGNDNIGGELALYLVNIGTEEVPIYYNGSDTDNRMTYTISQGILNLRNPLNILSTVKKVNIRILNQVTLDASDSYCYWILNDTYTDSNNVKWYVLFDRDNEEEEYLLNSGEYFIYTNSSLSNLTILGAGTLVKRSHISGEWKVPIKDASSIVENGINAFSESEWFKPLANIVLTEQYYTTISPGSTLKLNLARNRQDYLTAAVTSSSDTVSLNQSTFLNATTGYGTYRYRYTTNGWYEGTNTQSIVDLSSLGITYSGTPTTSSYINIDVSSYSIYINSEGVYNGDTQISLKDFDISYKPVNEDAYVPVPQMNLQTDNYTWNARTLLSLNISNTNEQYLLDRQTINADLQNIYYSNQTYTGSTFKFLINEVSYSFNYTSTINSVIFDADKETLLVNDEIVPYTVNGESGTEIELSNTYQIEGMALDTTTSRYPVAILSNYGLSIDGGQKLSTYSYDESLDIQYLGLYVFEKQLSNNPSIYYTENGLLNIEFLARTTGGYSRTIPFCLPEGDYIIPIQLGSDILTLGGFLHITYTDSQGTSTMLHALNSPSTTSFIYKKKYFVYIHSDGKLGSLNFQVNDTIPANLIVNVQDIFKFVYQKGIDEFKAEKIFGLIAILDRDNLFNYSYKVPKDEEIKDPTSGKSFFLINHIYNKFTIPQISSTNDIMILGRR